MFRSYDHPQGEYFVPCYSYSLKHSLIYFVILIWCCGSVSCVMCESYAVQLRPAVDVPVVLLVCYLNKLQNARCNNKDDVFTFVKIHKQSKA